MPKPSKLNPSDPNFLITVLLYWINHEWKWICFSYFADLCDIAMLRPQK
jgi:hypothetical protein